MNDEEKLFDLVIERPDPRLDWKAPCCPYCRCTTLEVLGHTSTLLGYIGNDPDRDPNHHWYEYKCTQCKKVFTLERKDRNVWYTEKIGEQEHRVLAGIPSCFESYVYHCAHCVHGYVRRQHTEKDGVTPARSLGWSAKDGKNYRTFYTCGSCGDRIELEHYDNWFHGCDQPPKPFVLPEGKTIEWQSFETMGAAYGNTKGLEKVDFS